MPLRFAFPLPWVGFYLNSNTALNIELSHPLSCGFSGANNGITKKKGRNEK